MPWRCVQSGFPNIICLIYFNECWKVRCWYQVITITMACIFTLKLGNHLLKLMKCCASIVVMSVRVGSEIGLRATAKPETTTLHFFNTFPFSTDSVHGSGRKCDLWTCLLCSAVRNSTRVPLNLVILWVSRVQKKAEFCLYFLPHLMFFSFWASIVKHGEVTGIGACINSPLLILTKTTVSVLKKTALLEEMVSIHTQIYAYLVRE